MALKSLCAAFSKIHLQTVITHRNALSGSRLVHTTVRMPQPSLSMLMTRVSSATGSFNPNLFPSANPVTTTTPFSQFRPLSTSKSYNASLYQMHKTGPIKKQRKNKNPLGDRPYARGVVLKTVVAKPKKPNSANRKCVLVRLTTGREMLSYVPGIGHNLQEHNIVLVKPGRLQDVPGVKLECVRGKYDLAHVVKKAK